MLKRVLEFTQKYDMLEPGYKVVVGVSGGADSLALLHILSQMQNSIPITLYVAHVNHGLRDGAAREDADFVEAIAKEWDFEFFLKEAQVSKLSKKWGISEEQAGRRVRYEFFEEVRRLVDGDKIALAHHRDDQAETILHNIIRGTGLAGLSGMKPVRDEFIIRPLLEVSRQEIEDYCHVNDLKYRTDHTNDEIIYTRNRIRHKIIPMIEEEFNPNFVNGLVRMGDMLRDDDEFLLDYSKKVFHKIGKYKENEVRISLSDFNDYHRSIRGRILRYGLELIKKDLVGIHNAHIDGIMDLALNSDVGSTLDLPDDIKIRRDYSYLVLSIGQDIISDDVDSAFDFEYQLKVPGKISISKLKIELSVDEVGKVDVLNNGSRCIYIDEDAVHDGLYVRNRRNGDRFRPLGMTGTQKLKDFFIDNKIPRHLRDSIPLVVDKDDIVWIAGYRMSEDYKVTSKTKRLLKLRIRDI